jgi:uncharacterized protein (DUF2062 family)
MQSMMPLSHQQKGKFCIRSSENDRPSAVITILGYNSSNSLRSSAVLALRTTHHVIVASNDNECLNDLKGLNVTLLSGYVRPGEGAAILASADVARKMGFSHIVNMGLDSLPAADDLVHFIDMIQNYPNAIIIGQRDFQQQDELGSFHFHRRLSSFLLRLQTGNVLKDTQSNFTVYPLSVLGSLKLGQKGPAFKYEVIVKAAWAGVKLTEVKLSVTPCPSGKKLYRQRFLDIFLYIILNVHYTFRSITPLPHRKIVSVKEQPGEKISVLRPIESLKTLLTENVKPRQLATAAALGIFLGVLPLIFCHTIIILFTASFFRLNKVVAVGASQLCTPPLVPALCIEVGHFIRYGRFLTEISLETLGYQALDRLLEWLIGSLFLAPFLAVFIGITIYITAKRIIKEKGYRTP